jgi:transcriptional regulator with XRE-family HTH domain
MARHLEDFIASLPPEEQHAIQHEAERWIAEELTLRALRKARACSQKQVGDLLHIKQAAVSRLERRTDMYVSTLRSFIEAMGGELDIIARFPEQIAVRITQFAELSEAPPLPALHTD